MPEPATSRCTSPTKVGRLASTCNQRSCRSRTSNMGSLTAEGPNGGPMSTSGARQPFRCNGILAATAAWPADVNAATCEGRTSRTSQPYTAWGSTADRQSRLHTEAGNSSMRSLRAVAKAFSSRGCKWDLVASCSFAPNTTPTILNDGEVLTSNPPACTAQRPGRLVHACTLVTLTPSRAHHCRYAAMRVSKSPKLPATNATSSAKLMEDTLHPGATSTPGPAARAQR